MNIQQTIIAGISEQLHHHDYLVLPGFGGFVLKSRAAHFSPGGAGLNPPAKTLGFNSQLRQNDGILASWLQRRLGCDAMQAMEHLHGFSEFCRSVLSARRRITLPGIGFFYLDFENNTCFEPQGDGNFQPQSFGLAPVTIRALVPEATQGRAPVFRDRVAVETPEQAKAGVTRNPRRIVAPVALAVSIFAFLILLVWLLPVSGELRASLFGSNAKGVYVPLAYPELSLKTPVPPGAEYVMDANGLATLELGEGKSIFIKVAEPVKPHAVSHKKKKHAPAFSNNGAFEVILGCFSIEDNAQRLVRDMNAQQVGAELAGVNSRGLHIVSAGSYETKELAYKRLSEVKDKIPGAWIRTRK